MVAQKLGRRIRIVETGQEFDTVKECAEAINGVPSRISECLSGKQKTHRGFTFKPLGEYVRWPNPGLIKSIEKSRTPVRIVETGQVFESLSACARYINGFPYSIKDCLKGRQRTHRGYTFERVE